MSRYPWEEGLMVRRVARALGIDPDAALPHERARLCRILAVEWWEIERLLAVQPPAGRSLEEA